MPAPRHGRVFLVKLEPPPQPTLFGSPSDRVREVLTGGNRTKRYGRMWIVGPVERQGNVLAGRIGYQGSSSSVAEIWDEEQGDFVEYAHPQGLTAPFAVDLSTLKATLQVRPPLIKINSLIGALEALLNEEGQRWRVHGAARETTLREWLNGVRRVTAVRATVRIPNPHWAGAPDLQTVMENAEAEVVSLEMQSEQGLALDSEFLTQTQHHIDRGYGEARYTGEVASASGVRESVYSTKLGSEEVSEELAADRVTGEVPLDAMRHHLEIAEARDDGGIDRPFHPPS